MSALPPYLKTWNFTGINQSVAYVSLVDEMSELLYRIKNFCVGTLGATVWGSSTGAVGNNTDQWSSKAVVVTRGANVTTANSWCVFNWGTGQICLSYVGATDDVARISFSPGSLFALAGTPTFTPTATDECIILAAVSLVNATTSATRVFHIVGDTARGLLRVSVFRQGTHIISFGAERMIEAPGIPIGTMYLWNSNATAAVANASGSQCGSSVATITGAVNEQKVYLNGAVRVCQGGTVIFNASASPWVNNPPLINGGVPPMPVFVGGVTAGNDGWYGTRIDLVSPMTASIVAGQTFDDIPQGLRMVAICGWTLNPWDPAQGLTMA